MKASLSFLFPSSGTISKTDYDNNTKNNNSNEKNDNSNKKNDDNNPIRSNNYSVNI